MDKHTSLTKVTKNKRKKNLHHRKDNIHGNNQRKLRNPEALKYQMKPKTEPDTYKIKIFTST
jgi:hypothetical protein